MGKHIPFSSDPTQVCANILGVVQEGSEGKPDLLPEHTCHTQDGRVREGWRHRKKAVWGGKP